MYMPYLPIRFDFRPRWQLFVVRFLYDIRTCIEDRSSFFTFPSIHFLARSASHRLSHLQRNIYAHLLSFAVAGTTATAIGSPERQFELFQFYTVRAQQYIASHYGDCRTRQILDYSLSCCLS